MKLNLAKAVACFLFLFINLNNSNAAMPDSTGLMTINGKQFIVHRVEPKEGWMSVARRYNVPMEQIKMANPGVEGLKIGQLINIPVLSQQPITLTDEKSEAKSNEEKYKTILTHTVAAGETLYSISKKYNVKTSDIRELNDIEDNNLAIGQVLKVGYVYQYGNDKNNNSPFLTDDDELYASAGELKKTRKELKKEKKEAKNQEKEVEQNAEVNLSEIDATIPTFVNSSGETDKSIPEAGKKAVSMEERGIASWIDDNDINPSKFYALHRTAPAGTIIKVTNRMNNKHVFVKVVGVLPNTGDNKNITIKLSKAAAMKLDVLDARFQAELAYNLYE